MSEQPIHIIIESCINGNAIAQKHLYEKYFNMFFHIALRYIKNTEDASDIVNKAFVKIFSKLHTFKHEGSFEGWMKRIVLNTVFNFIKKNKQYKKHFLSVAEIKDYPVSNITGEEHNMISLALNHLSYQELFDMITELPPATRIVFNLYAIDGYKHKEIARQLGIKESTSKWHLKNARKILAKSITQKIKKLHTQDEIRRFKY